VQSGGSKVMAMTLTMTLRNLVKEKKRVRVSASPSLALPWIGTASCALERFLDREEAHPSGGRGSLKNRSNRRTIVAGLDVARAGYEEK
jgi:hypothetical protein